MDFESRRGFDRYFVLGKCIVSQFVKSEFWSDFEIQDKSHSDIVYVGCGCDCLWIHIGCMVREESWTCLCLLVQALGNCVCCWIGLHISR